MILSNSAFLLTFIYQIKAFKFEVDNIVFILFFDISHNIFISGWHNIYFVTGFNEADDGFYKFSFLFLSLYAYLKVQLPDTLWASL